LFTVNIFGFIFGSFSRVWQKNCQNDPKNEMKNDVKNGYQNTLKSKNAFYLFFGTAGSTQHIQTPPQRTW